MDSCRSKNLKTSVIGCPKTIDGDLKCKEVPTSFGFDTACKVNEDIYSVFIVHFVILYCSDPYIFKYYKYIIILKKNI